MKIHDILKKYEEIIRYLIVGGLTTVLSCIIFYGSTWTFLDGEDAVQLQIANVLQWILSTAFAYFMNRKYVFKSIDARIFIEFVKFIISRIITLFLDMGVMFLGATLFGVNYNLVKVFSIVLVVMVNYLLGKILVFADKDRRDIFGI